MRVIEAHHDFAVLEARLAALIREAKGGGPEGAFAPVAVVAPSSRLLAHLQIRLASEFGGLAGLHFLHHQALAREAAEAAGAALPRPLSDRVREAILARVLEEQGGDLAAYARARPGSVAALLSTINDLREAGVDPGSARGFEAATSAARASLALYAAYAARLDELAARRGAPGGGPAAPGLAGEDRGVSRGRAEQHEVVARGLSDRAGVLRAAVPHVRELARRFRLVVHYGAYEVIGANLALMKAVEESGVRLVYLVPWHPTSAAFEYARRFVTEVLGAEPAVIEGGRRSRPAAAPPPAGPPPMGALLAAPGPATGTAPSSDRLLGPRLPSLYDEESAALPPLDGERVSFFHAQGAESELRQVALRILALHRDHGVPLREIAVVARSLEPYAPLLRPVLEEHGLPFTTSARLPALREPRVQAALWLARAALGDFERQPLMDLLRCGLVREGALAGRHLGLSDLAHGWDRLAREWMAARGYETWTRDLPRWLEGWEPYVPTDADEETRRRAAAFKEARRREAASLAGAVRTLAEAAAPLGRAIGWEAWAGEMGNLCGALLDGFEEDARGGLDAGARIVLDVLEEMGDLDATGIPFSPPAALAFFERGLSESKVRVESSEAEGAAAGRGRDDGGVRVLDAMQARGCAFEAVFLIGWNADLIPRRPREDPFLDDATRRRLRERLRAPVPVKAASREEEHLILAHLLGAARRRITISWQRADEDGRAKVPSLALREAARVALGSPDLALAEGAARRVHTHPREAGLDAARGFGLLPPRQARLGAALELRSPTRLLESSSRLPASPRAGPRESAILEAGLAMLGAIEEYSPADLRFDAVVGAAAPPPATWSPSRLETLGACAQHYFFRHVLRVEEMEEAPSGYDLDPADMGLRVHKVLHEVYADLIASGDLSSKGADPTRAARRALDLVPRAWARHTADLAERLHARYPVLWEAAREAWLNAVGTFVLYDVADLARAGARVIGLEHEATVRIALPGRDAPLEIRGRFDRVCRAGEEEIVVADYKTSGRVENHVRALDHLKGTRLQMPLYVLMAEARTGSWGIEGAKTGAEVIGVGPAFAAGEAPRGADPRGPGGGAAPPAPEGGAYEARAALDAASFEKIRDGFLETLRVLLDLASSGSFPFKETSRLCGYCPYVRACRRKHAPTLTRLRWARQAREYALLRGKSTRAPFLADVRAAMTEEEE